MSLELSALPLNCVFESNFHHRLVLSTVSPIVAVGGIFLAWFTLRLRILSKGGDGAKAAVSSLTSKSIRLSIILLFTVFPLVSTTIFQTFQYDYRLEGGSAYLKADYSIEKGETVHQGYVAYAITMCLLYCFGIPVASWVALRSKKDKIQSFMVISESVTSLERGEILECEQYNDDGVIGSGMSRRSKALLQKQIVTESLGQFSRAIASGNLPLQHEDRKMIRDSLVATMSSMNEQDPWLSGLSPLYKDYKSGYWWFEVPKFVSTLVLCGPVTLIPVEGASQVFISMVVSMFMMSLFANCRPYNDFSSDVLAQFCQTSLTFAMATGLLEKASESSRDMLFGPLLVACTSINLGLGFAVMVSEFFTAIAMDMPATKAFSSLQLTTSLYIFFTKRSLGKVKKKKIIPAKPRTVQVQSAEVHSTTSQTNPDDTEGSQSGSVEKTTVLDSRAPVLTMTGEGNQSHKESKPHHLLTFAHIFVVSLNLLNPYL